MEEISEGSVKIVLPEYRGRDLSKKMPVFYNPKMKENRDITIAIVRAWREFLRRDITIFSPLEGSGVRALRFIKECPGVIEVVANDINPRAVEIMKMNAQLNSVSTERLKIYNKEARTLMAILKDEGKKFDVIDIDPFGSPINFLDMAFSLAKSYTLFAITSTDIGTLSGHYERRAFIRYGAHLRDTPIKEEIAVRNLYQISANIAAQKGFEIYPIFAIYSFYVRIFFYVKRKSSPRRNGKFMLFCEHCYYNTFEDFPSNSCPYCGKIPAYLWPLWAGAIYDREILKIATAGEKNKKYRKKFELAIGENEFLPLYNLREIAKREKTQVPSKIDVISSLQKDGFSATLSALCNDGIRTNANYKQIISKF